MYNLALTQMLGTRQESVNTLQWDKTEKKDLKQMLIGYHVLHFQKYR